MKFYDFRAHDGRCALLVVAESAWLASKLVRRFLARPRHATIEGVQCRIEVGPRPTSEAEIHPDLAAMAEDMRARSGGIAVVVLKKAEAGA